MLHMDTPEYYDELGPRANLGTINKIYSAMSSTGYFGHRGREPFGVSVEFTREDEDLEGVTIWLQRAHRTAREGLHTGCFGTSSEDIALMGHRVHRGPVDITQAVAERVATRLESRRQEAEKIGLTAVRELLRTNLIRDPNVY